jgi:mono/diheme cytochrome c family protein
MNTRSSLSLIATALAAVGLGVAVAHADDGLQQAKAAKPAAGAAKSKVVPADAEATYVRDVLPIFMGRCSRCHNDRSILYNWLDYKTAFSDRREIKRRVWDSYKGKYFKQSMPAGGSLECQAITESERMQIRDWVDGGAIYGQRPTQDSPRSKTERIAMGEKLFTTVCALCHQPTGQGIPNQFPPLAKSDFLNADKDRAIRVLLHGRQGEIVVNGRKFNNSMPSFPLGDDDIASALTFVYNSFGNSGKEVTADEVKSMRAQKDWIEADAQQNQAVHTPSQPSPFE